MRWADPLCEGPLHLHQSDRARQTERAAYLASRFALPMTETYRRLMAEDWRVDQCIHYDETILWFEADLFDQIILVYLLARLGALQTSRKLSLICVGQFPGLRRFVGLGQLTPPQLASLLPRRKQVTRGQVGLATRTWQALNAPDPGALSRLARIRSTALPFLPAALRRYLAEYPSVRNGLSRTEQLALQAVARGARTPAEVFVKVQEREARPFLGDSMLYAVLRGLGAPRYPAISGIDRRIARLADDDFAQTPISLTDTGKRVLANDIDWWMVSGVLRQLGGVTLRGPVPRWRWDTRRHVLVEQRRR